MAGLRLRLVVALVLLLLSGAAVPARAAKASVGNEALLADAAARDDGSLNGDGVFGSREDLLDRLGELGDESAAAALSQEEKLKRFTAYRKAIRDGQQRRELPTGRDATRSEWERRVYGSDSVVVNVHDEGKGGGRASAIQLYEERRIDEGEIVPVAFELSKQVASVSRQSVLRTESAGLRQYGVGGKGKGKNEPAMASDMPKPTKSRRQPPPQATQREYAAEWRAQQRHSMRLEKAPAITTECPPPGGLIADVGDRCEATALSESLDANGALDARRRVRILCHSAEWVFQGNVSLPMANKPTLGSLSDGTLVVAFQASPAHEGDPDQRLLYTFSRNTGASWTDAQPLIDAKSRAALRMSAKSEWGPALARPVGAAQLSLFFSRSVSCRERPGVAARFTSGGDVVLMVSKSPGEWSAPRVIKHQRSNSLPTVTSNQPIVLLRREEETMKRVATFVLPVWEERPNWGATCNITNPLTGLDLNGVAGVLRVDTPLRRAMFNLETPTTGWITTGMLMNNYTSLTDGAIAVVNPFSGHLVQFFHTLVGRVFMSTSKDYGRSWTRAKPIELPMPSTKLNAIALSNGMLAVAYNPSVSKEQRQTRAGALLRNSILIAVSADVGQTWSVVAQIEPDIPEHALHHPSMLQRGCFLFVVYTVGISESKAMDLVRRGRRAMMPMGIRMSRLRLQLRSEAASFGAALLEGIVNSQS